MMFKLFAEDHNVEEMDEFLAEIAIMKSISRHPNVVALIGYCTVEQPMLMVMEYVGCGDLVSYLIYLSIENQSIYKINISQLNYLRKLREQHELRAAAANRRAMQKLIAAGKLPDNSTSISSTLNLISQNSGTNKSVKNYSNSTKNVYSNRSSVTSANNSITVTTLNKLEEEVNYLELCHSS